MNEKSKDQLKIIDDNLEILEEMQKELEALYAESRQRINQLKPLMEKTLMGKHMVYSISGSEKRLRIMHRTKTREQWDLVENKPYRFKA
jgi:archaellum component FlaC